MRLHTLCACIPVGCAILLVGCSRHEPRTSDQNGGGAASAPAPGSSTTTSTTTTAITPSAGAGSEAGAPPANGGATAQTIGAAAAAAPVAGGAGAQVYQQYCATCHGPAGKGDGPASAGLNPKPASFATKSFRLDPNANGTKGEIDDIKAVVREGAAKYGGSPLMAPWPMLSPDQLQAVAEHVRSLGVG
ncbi:MAG TPA: cytochrome c [Steroidobacter sp.]|jgi:mono/diheme cytochrome c family protein|nr:cytochrome c [Steroidobacter sp.]